jgi:hypothetical protein
MKGACEMLSQKQNNFHLPEEETPPLEQEQTAPTASSWQGWSLWLRILGVVVALVGNVVLALLGTQDFQSLSILLLVLVGVVSAGLIRSWWSLLIVPVAFVVGDSLIDGFAGFFSNLLSYFTWFFIAFVEIGVAIGTPIGKWIEQRLRH